jgi:hypothetical protein
MLVAPWGLVLMRVVERWVHGYVSYLRDVGNVGRGDDLGDVAWLREIQGVLVLEDVNA